MGRVKQNKKSTFIDMTAMSDVTVLLLTFFMLTSTFLAKEPYQANTPPSVSTEEKPMNNVVEILVNPEGKVWLTMNNDTTQEASNAVMRTALLENMQQVYHEQTGKTVSFTDEQKKVFAATGSFGVPFEMLPKFLSASPEEQDSWLSGKEEAKGLISGIPVKVLTDAEKEKIRDSKGHKGCTEFQMWMRALTMTADDKKPAQSDSEESQNSLYSRIMDGTGITLKADQSTSFKVVHMVMDNMQTIGRNKFTLVTALKTEE